MAYQYVANKVMKTPTAKTSSIVMATSKQFIIGYLFNFLSNGEGHHLAGLSLKVVMGNFSTIASPDYCILYWALSILFEVEWAQQIVSWCSMCIYGNTFMGQSKDKVFVLRC